MSGARLHVEGRDLTVLVLAPPATIAVATNLPPTNHFNKFPLQKTRRGSPSGNSHTGTAL